MAEIKELVTGLQHIGLPCADMDATAAFYTSLGFELAHSTVNDGGRVCFFRLGGVCVEAYESRQTAGRAGAIDHIALDVTDIEQTWQAVSAAGYRPLESEIQALPFWEKGVRFFNILGPDSEKVEFSQIL